MANARQLPEQLLPSALASLTQVSAGEVHAVLGSRRLVTIKQNKNNIANENHVKSKMNYAHIEVLVTFLLVNFYVFSS